MDRTQLELDLVMKVEKFKTVAKAVVPAQIIDLQKVRNQKQIRKMSKVYDAILESVEHLVHTDKRFK